MRLEDLTLTADEKKRLWEFTLHEDGMCNERQGLFLIAESMLAVAYTTALAAHTTSTASVIAVAGLLVSVMWIYASCRHARLVEVIQEEVKSVLPEYAALVEARKEKITLLRIPSRYIVAYGVPPVITGLWVAFLIARL